MRIEQARAEAEEKKAAEAKAQKDALKNARRNAALGRELDGIIPALLARSFPRRGLRSSTLISAPAACRAPMMVVR